MRAPKTSASEFPNDNYDLHQGAIFALRTPCGIAEPEYALEATPDFGAAVEAVLLDERTSDPMSDADVDVAFVVDEDPTLVDATVAPVESGVVPATAFDAWLHTIHEVAASAGATVAFDELRRLLLDGRMDRAPLGEAAQEALVAGRIVTALDGELVACETFSKVAAAWHQVLVGEGGDLAECGGRTLDEWSADLAARMSGTPGKLDVIRRELRQRGVAAFGFVEQAA